MADQSAQVLSLFGDESSDKVRFGAGPLEASTMREIEEINAAEPLDAAQRMTAQICIALAQNIDAGNRKGRAIANEANQLSLLLGQLRETADDSDTDESIPADVRALFELGSVPVQHGDAEVRDET